MRFVVSTLSQKEGECSKPAYLHNACRILLPMHAEYSCGIVERNRFATVHRTIETCGEVEVLAYVLLIYGTIWTCVLSFAPRLPYPPSKVLFRHPLARSYDRQS